MKIIQAVVLLRGSRLFWRFSKQLNNIIFLGKKHRAYTGAMNYGFEISHNLKDVVMC